MIMLLDINVYFLNDSMSHNSHDPYIEKYFSFAGRGADDFRKGSRPRARPSHMALTYIGMVVGPRSVLSDDPDVIPGDQPA